MNEQIQKIWDQAAKLESDSSWEGQTKFMEKFAELIVKECIRVPYDMWDKAELNADVAVKIEHRIKEHFGVEE